MITIYILCKFFLKERTEYLPKIYCYRPNFHKFLELIATVTADHNILTKLCSLYLEYKEDIQWFDVEYGINFTSKTGWVDIFTSAKHK